MPRVPRRGVIQLAAPRAEVRDAAQRALGATDGDDETLVVPLGEGDAANFVRLHLTADGDATLVAVERHVGGELPFFGWFIKPLIGIGVRRLAKHVPVALRAALAGEEVPEAPAPPSFLPVGAFNDDQAAQLATAAAAAALVGFASALIGQLNDRIQETYHVSDGTLGVALAVTRFGALIAFVVAGFADRQGRRRALLVALTLAVSASGVSAIAPTFAIFTGAQLLVRAAVNATAIVAAMIAIEEAPEGARAFAAAMLALAGGFGYTFAVLAVPVADFAPWAWRLAFAASAATALLIPRIARHLRESTRYTRVAKTGVERGRVREVMRGAYGRRLVILALAAFLLNVFNAPSSQLTNKYLDDIRHFSGADIALFRGVTTAVPGIIGLLLAGPLAEVRGRRLVVSVGLTIGIAAQMIVYLYGGLWLWLGNIVATIAGAAGGVALGTVQIEMFPTEARGTSNALLIVVGVAGSAVGLTVAGFLSDPIGLGHALAWCGIGALIASIFLLPRLPESAQRLLDDVSPSDE
jgi:MFS transporter, SHS family, lactate transporter